MTTWLVLGIIVHFAAVFLPSTIFVPKMGLGAYLGSRDAEPSESGMYGRTRRILRNSNETVSVFLALCVAAIALDAKAATQLPATWGPDMDLAVTGAMIYVVARALFIPLYLFGVPLLRSAAWVAGFAGLVMMMVSLL